MNQLIIPIEIDLNSLSEKYLPFVNWDRVDSATISSITPDKHKYMTVIQLRNTFINQQKSGMCDEDVMAVIAREIYSLSEKYSYMDEYRLVDFMNTFVNQNCISNNYRQICSLIGFYDSKNDIKKISALFVAYGLLEIDTMIGKKLSSIDWNTISSTKVSIDTRYKFLKSGKYFAYNLEHEYELTELVPILTTKQIQDLDILVVPTVLDIDGILYAGLKDYAYLKNVNSVEWDTLIDLYYKDIIGYGQLSYVWQYFIRRAPYSEAEIESKIESKLSNVSTFFYEDFYD